MQKLFVISIVLILCCASCTKPKACIMVDKTDLSVSELTKFRSCSEHAHYVEWDFGDGHKKIGDDVSYGYSYPGTYVVTLTAHFYEDRKKADSETISITVH